MPFDPTEVAAAQQRQAAAAQDASSQVRLVAGPGTGKSHSIEQRAAHLLKSIPPEELYAVSFTRASTEDLRGRITSHCTKEGVAGGGAVRVSTLHSLALKLMRLANLLTHYPVEPRVLDDWETENWIDQEFARFAGTRRKRAREIRLEHEAFWSTGVRNPANYDAPVPAVTDAERQQFDAYHQMQSGFYACVLVGEIVRTCLTHVRAGLADPISLLNIRHLIVDEYQDLNPMDVDFIDELIARGVVAFVAGDDDQSVYSFRFASPQGIQSFTARHPAAGDHELIHCFRCAPQVLAAAQSLLGTFAAPGRIPKHQVSLYSTATPIVPGSAELWQFNDASQEADAIAESCARLIDENVAPSQIMILLGNVRVQAPALYRALDAAGVPFSPTRSDPFANSAAGRSGLCILRILQSTEDLVAHRILLGLCQGVGPTRCLDITTRAIKANLSASDLFRGHIPTGVLSPGLRTAVDKVRAVASELATWNLSDPLGLRRDALGDLVQSIVGAGDRAEWDAYINPLPDDSMLAEVLDFVRAQTPEEMDAVRVAIIERLQLPPLDDLAEEGVSIRTMHGAKGLAAKVVFIPGLEEEILPGPHRAGNQGLVLEGARLLYVSLTRARAAVICSFASGRFQHGAYQRHHPSRYLGSLGVPAVSRSTGLTAPEAASIATASRAVD